MKRFAALLSCAFLIAASGCCCHRQQQCNPCGYGAGFAPTYAPYSGAGGCPGGGCGTYPSGAYFNGSSTAAVPYGTSTTAYMPYGATAAYTPYPATTQTAVIDPIPRL